MKTPLIAFAGTSLVLAMTACGNAIGAGGELTGNSYLSMSVTVDGKPKQLAPNTRVRLQFTDDGRLVADAGCNSMQSKVSTSGGKLKLDGPLAMTAMGCPGPQQGQDSWLANILSAKPVWKLDGNTLQVSSGGTTISLTDRKTAEPAPALDGTKWSLETVITGETAVHLAGSENAWITLNGERVTGSSGCNGFQGMVARGTGTLTFGPLATTRLPCTEAAAAVEAAVLNGLKGQVTYSIDGNRLKIRTSTGGLDFAAIR